MKTKSRIIAIIAALCVLWAISMPVLASATEVETSGRISFFVDTKQSVFDDDTGEPYINADGRTMMPARACLDAIGCTVDWDGQTKTVLTRKGNVTVAIPIGKNEIIVNRIPTKIDTEAIILSGRTFLPLRAVLEAYGYAVEWDASSRAVCATELTVNNINGGKTGVFQRIQLPFIGFDGISAEITLPFVTELDTGDCPYIYFGFDWENGKGNIEGGFQFDYDPARPHYGMWTVFIRQGQDWYWGNEIFFEQGETRQLSFYTEYKPDGYTDIVLELDGEKVIRKKSFDGNFENASAKVVISMALTNEFNGWNCHSKLIGVKISNLCVRAFGEEYYSDFSNYPLYSKWRSDVGVNGMWYGTVNCVPSYIHYEQDGEISIYE